MPGALNVAGADYWVERDAVRDHFPQKLRQHYATISYGIIVTTISLLEFEPNLGVPFYRD